jgi:hypothetical protein
MSVFNVSEADMAHAKTAAAVETVTPTNFDVVVVEEPIAAANCLPDETIVDQETPNDDPLLAQDELAETTTITTLPIIEASKKLKTTRSKPKFRANKAPAARQKK